MAKWPSPIAEFDSIVLEAFGEWKVLTLDGFLYNMGVD
jgi:hypothetical protein